MQGTVLRLVSAGSDLLGCSPGLGTARGATISVVKEFLDVAEYPLRKGLLLRPFEKLSMGWSPERRGRSCLNRIELLLLHLYRQGGGRLGIKHVLHPIFGLQALTQPKLVEVREVEILVPRDGHGLITANSSLVAFPGLRMHPLILSHHLVCRLVCATISEAHPDEHHVVLQ